MPKGHATWFYSGFILANCHCELTSKTLEVTKLLSLCRNLKLSVDCKTHKCFYANRYIFVGHLILNLQIVFSLILFLNAEGTENLLKNALLFFHVLLVFGNLDVALVCLT